MSHFDQSVVRSRVVSPMIIVMLVLTGMMTIFAITVPTEVSGITVSGGDLIGDTHWTISDSPVDILDNISIPAGSTLTIDPGVTITLSPSVWIEVEGTIWAAGTGSSSIDFHRSHSSFNYDGINITSGGYGYLDHIEMFGSSGGIKSQGMGSQAYVYNSTLEGGAAGLRGQSGGFAWVVNCTINAPTNVTAQSGAEVHEGKWFFFKAVRDTDGTGVKNVFVTITGNKYPTELDTWTVFTSTWGMVKTDQNGIMPAIPVDQYKHMGSTSSIKVDLTMKMNLSTDKATWRDDFDGMSFFVGDNFAKEWVMDYTPPPTPTNLTVTNVTGSTIEVKWDQEEVPDLFRFDLVYKKDFEPVEAYVELILWGANREHTIDGLDEETTYDIRIRSKDVPPNESPWTETIQGKTLDITPPNYPTNFRMDNVGGDWVQLRWEASNSSDAIGYYVNVSEKDGDWTKEQYVDFRTTVKTNITGLPSETIFEAYIWAIDDSVTPNPSMKHGPIEFTTDDITPPVPPRLEFFPLDTTHYMPDTMRFNTSLVGFKVNVTGEDRTVIEIVLDGMDFVDPDGIIERWTTFDGVFQYYFFLSEGRHTAKFRSIDPSGNIGEYNQTDIWVDLTPPEMNIDNVTGDRIEGYFNEMVDLTLNITDESEIDSIVWEVSNNDTSETVEGTHFLMQLDVGTYDLSITAFDVTGNWNTITFELILSIPDTTKPGVISIEPEDGSVDIGLGPAIIVKFSEIILWDELSLDLTPEEGVSVELRTVLDVDNRTITFYPDETLLGKTNYTLTLENILDLSRNLGDPITIMFTTISLDDIDGDGDGIPDNYELNHPSVLSPSDPLDAALDYDNDGLSNLEEYQLGSEPDNVDSDDDGIPDGIEVDWGMNPTWASDAQGDKDNDGYSNLKEYERGSDPLDEKSVPEAKDEGIGPYIIIFILIIVLVLAAIVIFVIVVARKKKAEEEAEEEQQDDDKEIEEEPTWSEQEESHKKECPFCNAPLDEVMAYCPECGMTLPEEEVDEDSMDEDPEVGTSGDIPPLFEGEIEEDDTIPAKEDIPEPEDDLPSGPDDGMAPPSMDDGF